MKREHLLARASDWLKGWAEELSNRTCDELYLDNTPEDRELWQAAKAWAITNPDYDLDADQFDGDGDQTGKQLTVWGSLVAEYLAHALTELATEEAVSA